MRSLLDVNMLLALFDKEHSDHGKAQAWWDQDRNQPWATCPFTQNSFLRIISQTRYGRPKLLAVAFRILNQWTSEPEHEFWHDDLSLNDSAIIDHYRILSPRHLTDIYLLAQAVKHGGRLVTLDRGVPLAAVRGAGAERLVVV